MALILPNDIANDQLADGERLQQNYSTIEDWANEEAVTRDGSVAMTGPLLLPGAPTQPNQAATKKYVDDAIVTSHVPVPWLHVAFLNGWHNYDPGTAPPARSVMYRKVGDRVELRGVMAGGGVNMFCLQLPVGYRPPLAGQTFGTPANGGFANLVIFQDGMVNVGLYAGATNLWVHFDGITFSVTP